MSQIDQLIAKFRALARPYVRSAKKKEKEPNIFERIIAEDRKLFENIRHYIEFLKTESRKKEIVELLHTERKMFNDEIRSLKKAYNRILAMYVQLSPAERTDLYPQLLEFYHTVNNAIFSSVYGEKSKEQLKYFEHELRKIKDLPRKHSFFYQLKKMMHKEAPARHGKQESLRDLAARWLRERIKTEKQKRKGAIKKAVEVLPMISAEELPLPKPPQPQEEHGRIVRPAPERAPLMDLHSLAKKDKHKVEQLIKIQEQRKVPPQTVQPPLIPKAHPILDEEQALLDKLQALDRKPQRTVDYYEMVKSEILAIKKFLRQKRLKRAASAYSAIKPYLSYLNQKQQKEMQKEFSKVERKLQGSINKEGQNAALEKQRAQTMHELEEQEKKLISELDQVLKSL